MRGTDPTVLREHAYAGPALLDARSSIYQWQNPRVDLPGEVARQLQRLPAGAAVGDLGCGPGRFIAHLGNARPDLRCVGMDLSFGMAREVAQPALVGSLAALPLRSGSLDAALAMHVLYHVADPTVALAELRRVLAPGGTVIASSNDDRSNGLWQLFVDAGLDWRPISEHWPLHQAETALTQAGFVDVRLIAFDYTLSLPAAGPALSYLDSCRPSMPGVSPSQWQSARHRVATAAAGGFVGAGRTGLVIATKP